MVRCGGFTLAEVLVALVVLEVGLIAAVGTLVLAQRTLAEARVREEGIFVAEGLVDSLGAAALTGSGTRGVGAARVRWAATGGGALRVTIVLPDGAEAELVGWGAGR